MKKHLGICLAACLCWACESNDRPLTVSVTNPLDMDRTGEMVEVPMETVVQRLHLSDTAQVVVLDAEGSQVPYQMTYDEKLIFPATVAAKGSAVYTIQAGTPLPVEVKACGRQYPERDDDMAWENDLAGFRAYGPALQARGERGFGYDVFAKNNTTAPVLEEMYAKQLDAESWKKVNALRAKGDHKAADALVRTFTYHVDHGYGMDCYAVGATLGAGVAALLNADSSIVYPWCYRQGEVLDNGPLRFTVQLTFGPVTVGADTAVVETRLITLDAGSYLNRTEVSYAGLRESAPIVTGIVLHEPDGAVVADAAGGYLTYVDPTTGPDQGKLFMGAAFPDKLEDAKPVLFSSEEKKQRSNADGHVLAFSRYEPGDAYVYYWGFAWSKSAIQTPEAWNSYMADYAQKVREPLLVTVE